MCVYSLKFFVGLRKPVINKVLYILGYQSEASLDNSSQHNIRGLVNLHLISCTVQPVFRGEFTQTCQHEELKDLEHQGPLGPRGA